MKFLLLLSLLLTASTVHSAVQAPPPGSAFVYPSPVTAQKAKVVFQMAEPGSVQVLVYNEAAELVAVFSDRKNAGLQESDLDLFHFLPGVYLYRVHLSYDSGRREKLRTGKFVVE